ncbi:MAG: outer membrane beta-barrel protein [Bacteroidetes bacterium]|nr:outer membrane beta-barrel protein [Bacteroidota bacterium]
MKILKPFLALLFCFLTLQLTAQISLGIKGGYVRAWEQYNLVLPDDAKIHVNRFQVSALAYYQVNNYVSLGVEPGFTQRGAACVPGFILFRDEVKLLLNYLELPLMISVNVPLCEDKMEVFGKLGFGTARVIAAFREESSQLGDEPPIRTRLNTSFPSIFRRWDYGIYSGFGFAIDIGADQLYVESSYFHGLRDVDVFNNSKNRSLHFAIGYMVRL